MGKGEAAVNQQRCYPWLRLGAWRLPAVLGGTGIQGRPGQLGGSCMAQRSGFFPVWKAFNILVTDKTNLVLISSFWNALSAHNSSNF